MTWLLTGSILAVYLGQLSCARGGADVLGGALAFGPAAMAEHRYATLLTYAWAHAVPLSGRPAYLGFHLATNVVPLFCLGPALERWRGPWFFLALYLGGAVASALAWLAFRPPANDAMIGASGAVFALIGAAAVLGLHLRRIDLLLFTVPLRLNLRAAAWLLVALEAAQMLGRGLPEIAHAGHLGGALFGALFALAARARPQRPIVV